MLTNKQKKTLRAMAQSQRAIMQVGKDGLRSNSVKTLADALEAHELEKITLLKTCPIDVNEAAAYLCAQANCELVQKIGKTLVFYRRSKKAKLEI